MAFDKIRNDVKFAHFVDDGYTIGYRINDADKTIGYAVAYTHRNDKYNHKMGRQIAQGRLLKGGHFTGKIAFTEFLDALGHPEDFRHQTIVNYLDFCRAGTEAMLPAASNKAYKARKLAIHEVM